MAMMTTILKLHPSEAEKAKEEGQLQEASVTMDPKEETLEVETAEINESVEELVGVLFSTMATTMKVKHKAEEDLRREEEKEQLAVLQVLTMVEVKALRDRGQLLLAAVVLEELVAEKEKIEEIGKMTMMRTIQPLVVRQEEGESPKVATREVPPKKIRAKTVKRGRKAKMMTKIFLLAIQLAKTARKEIWRHQKRTP